MSYYKSKKGYYYKQTGGGSVRVSETTYRSKSMKGGDNCDVDINQINNVDIKIALRLICVEQDKIQKILNLSKQTTTTTGPKKGFFSFSRKKTTKLSEEQTEQYNSTLVILQKAYNALFKLQTDIQIERKAILNKQERNKQIANAVAVAAERRTQQRQPQFW
jgi:hypothetical protein